MAGVPEWGVHFAALCSGSFPSLPGPRAASPPTWLPCKDRRPGVLARGGSRVSILADEFARPPPRGGRLFCPFVWPEGPHRLSLASRGGSWPPRAWGAGLAGLGGGGAVTASVLRKRGARVDFPWLAGRRGGVCLQPRTAGLSLSPSPHPEAQALGEGLLCPRPPWRCSCSPVSGSPGGPGLRFLTDPAG